MPRSLLMLGVVLSSLLPGSAPAAQPAGRTSPLLASMVGRERPLLIFAGPSDTRLSKQYTELARNASGLHDRQLRIVLVTAGPLPVQPQPPAGTVSATLSEQRILRARFQVPPNTFAVVLVGKDGGEKFRSASPVDFATLAGIVDAMPMRQQEMRAH